MALDVNLIKMLADIERANDGLVRNEEYPTDNQVLYRVQQNTEKWREKKLAKMEAEGKDVSQYRK
jgi:hypothetical protein